MITSASATACCGVACRDNPCACKSSPRAGERFQPATVKPFFSRLLAKACPMAPSPSTATFGNVLILSVLIRVLIKTDLYYRISGTDVSSNNGHEK